jgi:hypothetical protein
VHPLERIKPHKSFLLSGRRSVGRACGRSTSRSRVHGVSGLQFCSGVITRRCVWPAVHRTFFVGDELEIQLGRCRVEIDPRMRRGTRFLWELRRCHTQALARAGWGRPPKGKEVWETGNLSHRHLAMCG